MQILRRILIVVLGCVSLSARAQIQVWFNSLPTGGETNIPAGATNVIAVSAGDYHCLALRRDGTVVAWGGNNWGQTNVPEGLTNIVAITANGSHSIALCSNGTLAYWGMSYYDGTNGPPTDATNIVALASGSGAEHSAAIRADGSLIVWGDPYATFGLTNIPPQACNLVSAAVGEYSVVAVRADGRIVSWGSGSPGNSSSASNIVEASSGYSTCDLLRADGSTLQLPGGLDSFPAHTDTNAVDIECPFSATGGTVPFIVRQNGTVLQARSSGLKSYPTNQIVAGAGGSEVALIVVGSGPPIFQTLPVNRTVGSGQNAYFRLPASGEMPLFYQWNCDGTNIPGATNDIFAATKVQPSQIGSAYTLTVSNSLGSITSGPMILNEVPFELYAQSTVSADVVGSTAVLSATTIGSGPFSYQWLLNGTNVSGATNSTYDLINAQLSDGGTYTVVVSNAYGVASNTLPLTITPTIVRTPLLNQGIYPGGAATFDLMLLADIPVTYQWQLDGTNILGETNNEITITNAQASNAGTYSIVYSDAYETVTNNVILSLVNVATWGDIAQTTVPISLTNATAIAAGLEHEIACRSDGTVVAWGFDQLAITNVPTTLSNAISLAAGVSFSLALKTDGAVVGWGYNAYGQADPPAGLSNVVAVAAGDYHSLALKSDGTVVAWGEDTNGQIDVPPGLTNVVAISANSAQSVALLADGGLVAWGSGTIPQSLPPLTQIATEDQQGAALAGDGSIVYWGSNPDGESDTPSDATNIFALGSSLNETVAVLANGTVLVWGLDNYSDLDVPSGLTNVMAVSQSDSAHIMALIGNGPPKTSAEIESVSKTAQGVAISIPSRCGHVYRLEFTDSLGAPVWNPFPLVAGTGRTIQLTDPNPGSAERFYRVRRW